MNRGNGRGIKNGRSLGITQTAPVFLLQNCPAQSVSLGMNFLQANIQMLEEGRVPTGTQDTAQRKDKKAPKARSLGGTVFLSTNSCGG
jgi:hypothetical protein